MHCPKCGIQVQDQDIFCFSCGYKLPDFTEYIEAKKKKMWLWLIPLVATIFLSIATTIYYYYEESLTEEAIQTFKMGEAYALEGKYKKAKDNFTHALILREDFPGARLNLEITTVAEQVRSDLKNANIARNNSSYDQAQKYLNDAEKKTENYGGKIINSLLSDISVERKNTLVSQLKYDLEGKTAISDLKPLLLRAQSIDNVEAKEIAKQIKQRIVESVITRANERMKTNAFTDALTIVEEGLNYDETSEKLLSLKATIKKEQFSFESQQQERIEQAMAVAAKDREKNKNEAVELIEISAKLNEYGDLIVSGKIKSVATVPINSIQIKYKLYNETGQLFNTFEGYIYPETLYPDDIGNFDFTHYNISEVMKVKVDQVTWYLD